MTGGGLMQLVAYGAQDVYLTGNPQITFFKAVYRRHTNFAMESIENPFNGNPRFGNQVTCTIQRNGDLIHRIYLQATLPSVSLVAGDGSGAQFRWLNWVGHNLVDWVELQIGGQRIDKHYGDWLHIWNELSVAHPATHHGLQSREGYATLRPHRTGEHGERSRDRCRCRAEERGGRTSHSHHRQGRERRSPRRCYCLARQGRCGTRRDDRAGSAARRRIADRAGLDGH